MKKPNRRDPAPKSRLKGNQINWNQVYYFSEIASRGSIKEAAAWLELSPPTLSQHLAQLEGDLEVQLFHRLHRKLILTVEGNRLFQKVKTMFEDGQRLLEVASPVPLGCYPISVGLVPSPSIQVANQLLGRFIAKQGLLNMKLFRADYSELEKSLVEGRFDIAFSDRMPGRKDLLSRCVSKSTVSFFVSPKWVDTPFAELITRIPLLICNAEPANRSLAEQALIDADLAPSAVVTSDYPSTLLDFCLQGVGIGVFSEVPIRRMGMRGLTSLKVPRGAPKLQDHLYAIWAKGAENSAAVQLLQRLIAENADAAV